ncbi:hypothetical protein ND861_13065 [Leptospira sp. 2 VSF19]|uniref:Lipoprotein n=1 Tax=Leptospira soteropolitanensis TaxID=2950025 RepID=A0AAW5VMG6_9LEPT|nr:hypothetical protein [Leptospira soteropolitanensis]MCW7493573.1 hypothetical protein [Leptospira soteropolitanensis]MCW7501172.1 hypothetical protein [Leptospira soteropolitanensis]MCW7523642.1 hypothetical protein [Leptospira soteropolitanensis]MCW7527285.1 hypothetical protein [Leptospira soteropolitanensis]MCW7531142.1 hypothetical protein [Leptospira soteropolitanensis]
MKKIILVFATLFLLTSVTNCVSIYQIKSGNKGKMTVTKHSFLNTDELVCDVTAQDDLSCVNIEGAFVNNPSLGANN